MSEEFERSIFNERFKELIKDHGLTQEAAAAKTGLSQAAISSFISGRRQWPSGQVLAIICQAFDVSADYLLGTSNVQTLDTTTAAICKATGLSQEAVDGLRSFIPQLYGQNQAVESPIVTFLNEFLAGGNHAPAMYYWGFSVQAASADVDGELEKAGIKPASAHRSFTETPDFKKASASGIACNFVSSAAGRAIDTYCESLKKLSHRKEGK